MMVDERARDRWASISDTLPPGGAIVVLADPPGGFLRAPWLEPERLSAFAASSPKDSPAGIVCN